MVRAGDVDILGDGLKQHLEQARVSLDSLAELLHGRVLCLGRQTARQVEKGDQAQREADDSPESPRGGEERPGVPHSNRIHEDVPQVHICAHQLQEHVDGGRVSRLQGPGEAVEELGELPAGEDAAWEDRACQNKCNDFIDKGSCWQGD